MIRRDVILILTLLIFIAPLAISAPTLVNNTQTSTVENSYVIDEGETIEFDRYLEITATDVTANSIDITVVDTYDNEVVNTTISVSDSEILSFNNGDITVTFEDSVSQNTALLNIEYNTSFGWSDGELAINQIMPVIILAPILIILLVIFYAVIEGDYND